MTRRSMGRLIYLIIVVVISGFALYEYKASQKEEDEKKEQEKIFPFLTSTQVQKIHIQKIKENIVLERKEDHWYLLEPIQDKADDKNVISWLEELLAQKLEVKKKKDIDWSEYHLDKNVNTIELSTDTDKNFKLSVSDYSGFDGSFFVKKENNLLLGDTAWSQIIGKDFSHFRSYYLIHQKQHPVSLKYRSGNVVVDLKWKNYEWSLVEGEEDTSYPLSNSAIESYWTSLANVLFDKEVQSYTNKAVKKYKLNKPYIELDLSFEKNQTWNAKISPKIKDKYYVKVSNRDYIFSVSENQMKQVLLEKMAFRDHKKPFQFPRDQVQFVTIVKNSMKLKLQKNDKKKWDVVEYSGIKDEVELDSEEWENILNRVLALSAKNYFGSKKISSLAAELSFFDKENNPLLQLKFSKPFTGDKNIKNVYVSSNKGRETMSVSISDFENIFSEKLLRKKNQDKKEQDNKMNVNSEDENNKNKKPGEN